MTDKTLRVAAIDVGTNTVRCLVADAGKDGLQPLLHERRIIRLGAGLRDSGVITDRALSKLREILGIFSEAMRKSGCRRGWAVGTSAVREARNRDQVLGTSFKALGFPLEVIAGDREAFLTTRGVQAGTGTIESGLVVDIGGGSTEFVRVTAGKPDWHASLGEGVVHLRETHLRSDPPGEDEVAAVTLSFSALLESLPDNRGRSLVATAGTPTTLAALDLGIDEYDPSLVNGHVLSRARVSHLSRELRSRSSAERLAMPGMEPGREDLIVPGVIMMEAVMERWGFDELTVSDWGLLEGVALVCAEGEGFAIT